MKKISPKKYARSLAESLAGLDKKQVSLNIANFVKVLAKNKGLRLAPKIIFEFNRYSDLQNGILAAAVISARKLTGAELKELADKIKKIHKVKEVDLTAIEDSTLIGGLVVKIGDEVLDASLKTRLELLKQRLIE
ncbi:MAG: ATP synthase F1 subunit delta [Patescibacteria group bacterium]|jgi:F-type H+-transporting ATPase subunit delta